MFIIQTTLAILIAFLALLAWNEIENCFAKGRARKKDLEAPGSPGITAASDIKPLSSDNAKSELFEPVGSPVNNEELQSNKALYHKLHNLEYHPEILPECRTLLLSLLSSTISDALKEPSSGILSIRRFSHSKLNSYLQTKDVHVTDQWEHYLERRKAGGSREMFGNKEEAKWWLKQAAPVKYVDGAWLGHTNNISTMFQYRRITKNAWQVMSEELGDGDLAKNHVQVYQDLMVDIASGLPNADSEDFIHPRHDLNEVRCWKAAMAQLLISLFAHEFLPEALGFNMAYESLPLHLLKTVKELRELRLNPYYFELHISIDNADSGHAAMAAAAVEDYIGLVEREQGKTAAHIAWKRVQAGYILAEGLPTTPESPSLKKPAIAKFPRNVIEANLLQTFAAKTFVAHKIHCNSQLKIGRRTLVDWLEPNTFKDLEWQKEFLHELSNCKPWVMRGDDKKSKLVKELSWGGKMFGSFTQTEVEIVKAWIVDLGSAPATVPFISEAYFEFTSQSPTSSIREGPTEQDILVHYPVLTSRPLTPGFARFAGNFSNVQIDAPISLHSSEVKPGNFLPLFFTSPTLLSALPTVPVRAANPFGSAIVRILRAQAGFDHEGLGVAGMDEVRRTDKGQAMGIVELGLEMAERMGTVKPESLKEVVALGDTKIQIMCEWMMSMSTRWLQERDVLVGMSWAFMLVHEAVSKQEGDMTLLSPEHRDTLHAIAMRERMGLEVCRNEIEQIPQRKANFKDGIAVARQAIQACLI